MIKYNDIPTKEQCDLIVQNNSSFYRTEQIIDGVNVHIYNYRLASYSDFNDPLGDGSCTGYWLRGLTFTENPDGTWKRWLMLPKFFNVGETIGWMPEDFRGKQIDSIQEKADGSLISFVKIGDSWLPKTKQRFDNEQADLVKSMNQAISCITPYMDTENEYCLFEICSPKNRIVVPYQETRLVPLCVVTDHGDSAEISPMFSIKDSEYKTVDDLLEAAKTVTGIEGWIVYCGGKIAKIKTDWYRRLHGLKFNLMRNDLQIFEATMTDTLDDALWLIDTEMPELRSEIEEKAQKFRDFFHVKAAQLDVLIDSYYHFEKDRKEFALANKDHELFGVACGYLFGSKQREKESILTEFLLKMYNADSKVKGILQ